MPGPKRQRAVLCVELCDHFQDSSPRSDTAKQLYRGLVTASQAIVDKNKGSIIRSGTPDLAAVFPLADAAFSTASKLLNTALNQDIPVRAGLHYDEVSGEDCDEVVVIAEQVCHIAGPGEILLTASTMPYLCGYFQGQCAPISSNAAIARQSKGGIYACKKLPGDQTMFGEVEPVDDFPAPKFLLLTQGNLDFLVPPDSAPLLIGRAADCDITLQGSRCSRNHAIIATEHNNYTLLDQSLNGTFVLNRDNELYPLSRQSTTLSGSGTLCFGATKPDNTQDVVTFQILDRPPE